MWLPFGELVRSTANGRFHVILLRRQESYNAAPEVQVLQLSQMLSTAGSMLIGLLGFVLGSRGAVAVMGIAGALATGMLVWLTPRAADQIANEAKEFRCEYF